jgi:methylated-DNA-[protein]-cysteine S-methyltransferase
MVDHASFQTELGRVSLSWTPQGICGLRFLGAAADRPEESSSAPMWVLDAMRRIMAHLRGDPQTLESVPVDLSGLTPFQRQVAEVLRSTRPGDRLSYGEIALLCGKPGAARAVGRAVACNPILLLVPCHRVVSASGEGGWSAFGSLERLRQIRALEPHTGEDGSTST